jgi:hypothetical protein
LQKKAVCNGGIEIILFQIAIRQSPFTNNQCFLQRIESQKKNKELVIGDWRFVILPSAS